MHQCTPQPQLASSQPTPIYPNREDTSQCQCPVPVVTEPVKAVKVEGRFCSSLSELCCLKIPEQGFLKSSLSLSLSLTARSARPARLSPSLWVRLNDKRGCLISGRWTSERASERAAWSPLARSVIALKCHFKPNFLDPYVALVSAFNVRAANINTHPLPSCTILYHSVAERRGPVTARAARAHGHHSCQKDQCPCLLESCTASNNAAAHRRQVQNSARNDMHTARSLLTVHPLNPRSPIPPRRFPF
jgi:hypothetical protein